MHPAYGAYRLISSGLFFLLFPVFGLYAGITGRHRTGLEQRMGRPPAGALDTLTGSPRIWLHAASVGEVGVAAAVVGGLRVCLPGCSLIVSTTTEHGLAAARRLFGADAACVVAPVDATFPVRRTLRAFRPQALVLLETEIWPNWLVQAQQMGVKTAIVNGRISGRSIRRYLRVKGVMSEALGRVDAFSMIQAQDARRIQRMGAPPERISVNGNAKYDLLAGRADPILRTRAVRLYGLAQDVPVLVAGSTRDPEEAEVLDVFSAVRRRFPSALLILAPRHVERAPRIRTLVEQRGFSCQLRTALDGNAESRHAQVVILDTMGELSAAYSAASVVFCGGSLAPLGGQNPLEAAAWGKPVLYGPSMDDFTDARALLESTGGGVQVADSGELTRKILELLAHPEMAHAMGRRARKAVSLHTGAANKHAAVIAGLLDHRLGKAGG